MSDSDRVQYKFMIPARLKERLENAAHEGRRSLSAEIIERLEASFVIDESINLHEKEMADIRKTVNELKVGFALLKKHQQP